MHASRFQFRLNTIMIVVALAALALGLAKASQDWRPRRQRASDRVIAEVLDARDVKKTDSTSTNDAVLITSVSMMLALAWKRRSRRERCAGDRPREITACRS